MNVTGYYGKLPQRGDFVAGKLPDTFRTVWDDWAQQLVTVGKEVATSESNSSWFNLPIYRFYLSSRIAGDNAWIGIMLPSSDSVGRLYPFCFAHSIDANCHAYRAFDQYEAFFQKIEKITTDLCAGELSFDQLPGTLAKLDRNIDNKNNGEPIAVEPQSHEPGLCIRIAGVQTEDQSPSWDMVSAALLDASCSAHSIWTTSPISDSSPETLIFEALPSKSSIASLFTGNFDPMQWTQMNRKERLKEYREENTIGKNENSSWDSGSQSVGDTDTNPLLKKSLSQPEKTDFLELDDNDSHNLPWDD